MSETLQDIVEYLNGYLDIRAFQDTSENGLQVENGCRIEKIGVAVDACLESIVKANEKYQGTETLEGAAMSSDGFFPFRDAVDAATGAGITAIVQPGGSVNDYEAIEACNDAGASMVFAMERCFSHH